MTELDDMRSFIAAVEAGGFSRGAQRLGLAKSVGS
jgi:DNA-binding transcriptional LysR family regulator